MNRSNITNAANTTSSASPAAAAGGRCVPEVRKWYIYIGVEFSLYFGGLLVILLWRLSKMICCRRKHRLSGGSDPRTNHHLDVSADPLMPVVYQSQMQLENVKDEYVCFLAMRYYVSQLISTQYRSGRLLLVFSTICSALSISIYLYEVLSGPTSLERCYPMRNPLFCIDLGCNIVFLLHLLLRLTASNEKVFFWLSLYTVIDMFTVPQVIISPLLDREWIGLRFLRIVPINQLQTVLQCLGWIKSANVSRVTQLITIFVTILVGGAGFVHLLENSGEFCFDSVYRHPSPISYGNALYFVVVTMSTVGYGDYSPNTVFGKIFVTIFILTALAIFASFIPELAEFLFSRSAYLGNYKKESGRKHVIVCGNINYASVMTFLSDFLHEDRSDAEVGVVFINKQEPDSDLKSLLKSYFVKVKYFQGTVMDQRDLERVQMHSSDACLILANQDCSNSNDEDSTNIMRAISVKNECPCCPVIIQILQFENKIYLENIPAWNERLGDHIICYSEIEMGILAQSCMVPGFSTMLTNIFSVRSDKECDNLRQGGISEGSDWLADYIHGGTMEIYPAKLSPSLRHMTYAETVSFCFGHLNLLLIAVELQHGSSGRKVLLMNPLGMKKIPRGSTAYFVCDSYKDAHNASVYCSHCHSGLRDLKSMRRCSCEDESAVTSKLEAAGTVISRIGDVALDPMQCSVDLNKMDQQRCDADVPFMDTGPDYVSGDFYQCSPAKLTKCVISTVEQADQLRDHIILCVFSDPGSTCVGSRNFLLPLRNTAIAESQLKTVVIIASRDFIESEWSEISIFPKLKVIFYNRSIRRIIDLIGIDKCARCVIINAKSNSQMAEQNDLYMVDKEVIITNLYFQSESRNRMLRGSNTTTPQKSDTTNTKRSGSLLAKKESVSIELDTDQDTPTIRMNRTLTGSDIQVPIISKLAVESNVQFLDTKSDYDKALPNYLRKPFAFGCVFTASMLDSLVSTAYFSQNAIKIMEMLINGGCLLPNSSDSGQQNQQQDNEDDIYSPKNGYNKFRMELFEVTNFSKNLNWQNNICYRDFFIEVLDNYSYLCFGVYRKVMLNHKSYSSRRAKLLAEKVERYVITNPPTTFVMDSTDLAYCIVNHPVVAREFSGSNPMDESYLKESMIGTSNPPICDLDIL